MSRTLVIHAVADLILQRTKDALKKKDWKNSFFQHSILGTISPKIPHPPIFGIVIIWGSLALPTLRMHACHAICCFSQLAAEKATVPLKNSSALCKGLTSGGKVPNIVCVPGSSNNENFLCLKYCEQLVFFTENFNQAVGYCYRNEVA